MITESRIVALIIQGILIKLTKRVRISNRALIDHYRRSRDKNRDNGNNLSIEEEGDSFPSRRV